MEELLTRFLLAFGAMVVVGYSARYHRPLRMAFRRLARRKTACILLLAVFPVALRLAMLPKLGPPDPFVHDEFSYLLASDTFAQARMTNPPHPMWIHFETLHEQFLPTYASKYPPSQGIFLAIGQRVFGHPWAGVLISVAVMSASLAWMLQGWLPPAWALLGTLIGVVNLTTSTYWVDSYWGGAVGATGGCLVMGAYPRLRKRYRIGDSVLFGAGIVLLANTRPYEGLVLTSMVCIALLIHSVRSRSFVWVIPAALVVAAGAAAMARYNYRVTGSAFTIPYLANERMYAVAPAFLFVSFRPVPHYNHEVLRQYWSVWDVEFYNLAVANLSAATTLKLVVVWQTLVRNWLLSIPILFAPFLITSRRGRFPLLLVAVFICAILLQKGTLPHYSSPIAGTFFVVLALALHRMYLWKPNGKPTGKLLANVVLVSWFFYFVTYMLHFGDGPFIGPTRFTLERRKIIAQLEQDSASHLVMVRYQANHNVHAEWVYNRADIDGSKIVWAREMNADRDRELLNYYPQRKVWRLEPDFEPPKLTQLR